MLHSIGENKVIIDTDLSSCDWDKAEKNVGKYHSIMMAHIV